MRFLILAFIFLFPTFLGGGLNKISTFIYQSLCIFLFLYFIFRFSEIVFPKLILLFLPYLLLLGIYTNLVEYYYLAFSNFVNFIFYLILCSLLFLVFSKKDKLLLFVMSLILLFFFILGVVSIKEDRLFYSLRNPNLAAHFLLLNLALLGFLLEDKKNLAKLLFYTPNLFLLTLTDSKGGILGALFYLSFLTLQFDGLLPHRKIKKNIYLYLLVLLFLFFFFFVSFDELKESFIKRLDIWQKVLQIIFSPIFGIGLGNFPLAILKELKPNEIWSLHTHNIFLQFLIETGIIGLVFFFIPIFYALKSSSFHLKAGLISYIIASLFDYSLWLPVIGVYFFLILSLLIKEEIRIKLRSKLIKILFFLLFIIFWFFSSLLPYLAWHNFFSGVEAAKAKKFPAAKQAFEIALKYQPNHKLFKAYWKATERKIEEEADFYSILGRELKSLFVHSYFSPKSYIYITSLIYLQEKVF